MKNIKPAPRKRPPKTGTLVGVRLQDQQLKEIDDWIMRQRDVHLSRADAIRRALAIVYGPKSK